MISKGRAKQMDQARGEGIVFTPQGEPLFARDFARWGEILATPAERTQAPSGFVCR